MPDVHLIDMKEEFKKGNREDLVANLNREIELNDATRVEVRLVDAVNNVLRFDSSVLNIEVNNAPVFK